MKSFVYFGLALLAFALGLALAAPSQAQSASDDATAEQVVPKHDSRFFFGPTARAVAPGSVYITWQEFILVSGAVGIDPGVTLLGGFTLVPGTSAQFVYVAPKLSVLQKEKTAVAVGAFIGAISSEMDPAGLLYGAVTRGTADAGVTLGIGFAFGDGEVYSKPAIMVGLERRLTKRTRLLSENYIIPEAGALFLLGVRMGSERMTFDIAGMTTSDVISDTEGWPFFPWGALTWSLR